MQTSTMQAIVDQEQSPKYQKIEFQGSDDSHTVEICDTDVTIIPSAGDHSTGSSKVKLQNVVDYTWEERFYTGQLLAVHMAGKYLAYGIKAAGKTTGVVRVLNRETSDRALIKGMDGMVQDIAFAYIPQEILLGCVDQAGNLFVHQVMENKPSGLICTLLLHVVSDKDCPPVPCHRVVWCPYIPEDGPKNAVSVYDDVAGLLALTRGTKVELWNVPMVKNNHGVGPVKPGAVEEGYLEVNEHSQTIVDAAFSPDGTAIATASFDGEVKFFQVYMQNGKPRCLHQWKPHNGRPLSSLFFLDNHKNYNPEAQFWKFAVTGANENSELKLWSCETWSCLQTIRFMPRSDGGKIQLKASMDLGSSYLLLTDHVHRVLFVMQVQKDETETNCFFQSVSEFSLPYPILSFGIVDAGLRRFKSDTFTFDDLCNGDGDEEEHLQCAIVIRMYLMQPKSLQECHIVFQPSAPRMSDESPVNLVSQESLGYRDELTELPTALPESVPVPPVPPIAAMPEPMTNHNSLQLNLMTPDAFSSPVKRESPASSVIPHPTDTAVLLSETVYSTSPGMVSNSQSPIPDSGRIEGVVGFASGGSSPSREVQKIFSLQGKCYFPETDKPLPQQVDDELVIPDSKPEESEWPMTPMAPVIRTKEARTIEDEQLNGNGNVDQLAFDFVDFKNNVNENLAIIQNMLQKQDEEIKNLKEDLKRHNNIRELEKAFTRQMQQQNSIIESALSTKDNDQHQEALLSAISQTVDNIIATKLDHIVTSEINSNILPAVVESMENLKQELHIEMTQKLSATDHLLKENISKLVNSKSVMDVLSNALVTAMKPCLADAYKESFMNVALPSYEKACAAMFSQLNETFSNGTKEYVNALEGLSRKLNERARDSSEQIQSSVELIRTTAQQMSLEVNRAVSSIETRMGEALRAQQTALEGSVLAAVRSGALTPAPDSREAAEVQIFNLIQAGHYNTAFQQVFRRGCNES
ncbi:enhancer of mRNA-decapping protein 4 homolog Ge-1 isoform X2 [Lycorma delicatula]|uniref:enhancer of mRNA-decapping protein 4 homolog Ge-1 isoform X2 n=1 Tax=Lycorma delicatula TaxID=130591 RepID=UPI003F512939